MAEQKISFVVEGADMGAANGAAQALADRLREVEGVRSVVRRKADPDSMDLGAIVDIVSFSSGSLAIANVVVAWLRPRPRTTLKIERDKATGSVKAEAEGIDADVARRLVELVRRH